jgi:hypothetical protein
MAWEGGVMFTYTTCRDCGGLLHTTDGDTVHPGCTPKPTKLERLLEAYVAALKMGDQMQLIEDLEREISEAEHQPPRMAEAALAYVSWGWPVFPLLPTGEANPRTGEISDGKKPATRHGLKDATTDRDTIAAWWDAHPQHNIGLPTGGLFDVVDIDPRHGGMESYRAVVARENEKGEGLIPDIHAKVGTGNGGWHLYVKPLGGGNTVNLLPGIDIRGLGGYVVGPPSWLGDFEHRYMWLVKPSPVIRK